MIDPSTVFVVLIIFFTAFMVVGNIDGRRRVDAAVLRVREAVEVNGGKLEFARKTSSTALLKGRELGMVDYFSVMVGIVPKVNPLTYFAARAAGRKDLMMLRGALKKPPQKNIALVDSAPPTSRYAPRWGRVVGEVAGYLVCVDGEQPKLGAELLNTLKTSKVKLIAVRSELPHVYAYVDLSADLKQSVKAVLEAIEALTLQKY